MNHTSPRRRRRKKKDHEKILEIIVENFPKLGKEIIMQVQKTQTEGPKMSQSWFDLLVGTAGFWVQGSPWLVPACSLVSWVLTGQTAGLQWAYDWYSVAGG